MFENSSTDCVLKEIEIDYDTESSVKLDQAKTAAYVCSGQTIGHILVAAIDGVAPYTYQLWDETGTNKLIENDIVSSGAARFNYGTAGTKYMIKITDNCKDAFNHVITMTKLEDVHIAYAPDGGVVCEGQTIQLRCVSLGETNYYWEGPNGWRANDVQYPMIPNAQSNMGGWYKVRVNPELCGEDVLDSIFITIADLPVAPTVNKTTLKYCLNEISQSLTQAAEISISSGNSLKCYAEDGTTEINPDELINTSTEGSFIFFVSQLSPSMCESARVQITVNIYLRPV